MTLVDEFVSWYLAENPVMAALLGADGYDRTLGDFSAAAFTGRERAAGEWLRKLSEAAFDDPEDEIDRDLVASHLRGAMALARWPEWRRDPAAYLGLVFASMFTPFQQRLKPEAELVDAAVARLAEVPAVLAACRANLDPEIAADLLVRRGLDQARTGRRFLTETLPAQVGDPELRARLARAAEPAADAFDGLVGFLEDFRPRGSWRMGEELYSALLREREMLGYGAPELHEKGRQAWAELDGRMTEVASRVGPGTWREVMESLMDNHPPTLEAMRAEYEAETLRARDFVRQRGLVTFPEGRSAGSSRLRSSSGPSSPWPATSPRRRCRPRATGSSSCRTRPTASPGSRCGSGCEPTRGPRCPRSASTRPTPATTGTSGGWPAIRAGPARSSVRRTSWRAGRSTSRR